MSTAKFEYKKYQYYGIITIASLFAVFFLPMIGSTAGLAWSLPNTVVGWIVYIITKLLIASLNLVLFYSFMEQAKINVKDNPYYIEANEILMRYGKLTKLLPRDPDSWEKEEYHHKGITIAITTVISAIGLTQAILTFDWLSMLTYLFTVVMGIIFGILQMNTAETYWTTEYWQYAKMVEREMLKTKADIFNAEYDCPVCGRGTVILESSNLHDNPLPIQSSLLDTSNNNLHDMGSSAPCNSNSNCANPFNQENTSEVNK